MSIIINLPTQHVATGYDFLHFVGIEGIAISVVYFQHRIAIAIHSHVGKQRSITKKKKRRWDLWWSFDEDGLLCSGPTSASIIAKNKIHYFVILWKGALWVHFEDFIFIHPLIC